MLPDRAPSLPLLPPPDWPRKLRSSIPRARRHQFRLPHDDPDAEAGDVYGSSVLGADSATSSCFASVVTSDWSHCDAHDPQGSRKREREAKRRADTAEDTGEAEPGREKLRRIGLTYTRRAARIEKLAEGEREPPLAQTKQVELVPLEVADETGPDFTVSAASEVTSGILPWNIPRKARSSRGPRRGDAPEVSDSCSMGVISAPSCFEIETYFEFPPPEPPGDGGAYATVTELGCELECSEQLSIGVGSGGDYGEEYNSCNEMTLSEVESELLAWSSEDFFSDLSQSFLTDEDSESAEGFSDKSRDDTTPSVAYALYLQIGKEFTRSATRDPPPYLERPDKFTLFRFEDEDEEESYKLLRLRERRILLYDYTSELESMEESGALVLQERPVVVSWIVEHFNTMKLQNETLFLGVSLMDRFLSKGFFNSKRNLHLLGIACTTLATRLEENQPYNSVHRRTFEVGKQSYSRSEVVAMEWFVQEVLRFQCYAPTIYNFLWFYLKAAKADLKVERLAKYFATLCLVDHHRLRFWPSTVAAGLVVLACVATHQDQSSTRVMETHIRTKNDDLPQCIKSLEWLVRHVH